ncbi:MAG: hypothetical protein IJ690_05320 [Clostridia bacterium]|nr:hypothetical protein [Clostridia bacterium]
MTQVKAILGGILAALITILALITFGTQTPIEVYSVSRFQNFLILFFILEITSIAVEFGMDSLSKDVAVDTLVAILIAIITTTVNYKKGLILFSGNVLLFELVKKMIIPGGVMILFACLGSSHVSKLLTEKKDDE